MGELSDKTLVLTHKGAEARAKVFDLLWEPPPAFAALTDEEQATLRDLLAKVAAADEVLRTSGELSRMMR